MKYKIAICKITMIGSPCLVLGICRYDDTDEIWHKYQLFTCEELLNCKFIWKPDSWLKNQEHCDTFAAEQRQLAQEHSKFHGRTVHFDSINKDVKILQKVHDFDLTEAEPVELTKDELILLEKEMNKDSWQVFDDETWGK